MVTHRWNSAVTYSILVVFCAVVLIPVASVVLASLNPPDAPLRVGAIPESWSFNNYVDAWQEAKFSTFMRTSILVSVLVSMLTVLVCTLAGFAFGTLRFRGSSLIFYVFLAAMVIPRTSVIIPLYFELRAVGMNNTLWSLVLPQVGGFLAVGTFWMRAFFQQAPRSLGEAARVDGAGSWAVLTRVYLPLARPAMSTLAVLAAMWSWGEFLLPLVMTTSENLRTVPAGLATFRTEFSENFQLASAAAIISALPIVVLFLALQRRFIAGLNSGSVVE